MKSSILMAGALGILLGSASGGAAQTYPASARVIQMGNPNAADGIYTLQPDGPAGMSFPAYCSMSELGGGWVLALASYPASEAPSSGIDANSANIPQPTSGYGYGFGGTRSVANLATYNNADVRFVISTASGEWFAGYYSGRYGPGSTLPPLSSWVLQGVPGYSLFETNLLALNFGRSWTNSSVLGTGWYSDGTSAFGTAPSCPANGLTGAGQGPTNSTGLVVTKFLVYVREQTLTFPACQSQLQFYAGINLTGTVGRTYQVEWASAADTNVWTALTNFVMEASPTLILDTTAAWNTPGVNQRFYRGKVIR